MPNLLAALLESWERNNTIMLNLLRALPDGALQIKAMADSPTVAQQFAHIHHERLVSVAEEAPEFAIDVPTDEWMVEHDRERIAQMLTESAAVVREAVKDRIETGRALDLNYGHPLLLIQLLLWHEGYHHGQIKLALKLGDHALSNVDAGRLTWDVWRRRMDPDA